DPTNPGTVYAGSTTLGVLKSSNGGATWTATNAGLGDIHVQSLALVPTNPVTLYAGTSTILAKSSNGGASWTTLTTGVASTTYRALAIDPSNASTVYAATRSAGLLKSTNGGSSWYPVNTGLATLPQLRSVGIDPTRPARIFIGTESNSVF